MAAAVVGTFPKKKGAGKVLSKPIVAGTKRFSSTSTTGRVELPAGGRGERRGNRNRQRIGMVESPLQVPKIVSTGKENRMGGEKQGAFFVLGRNSGRGSIRAAGDLFPGGGQNGSKPKGGTYTVCELACGVNLLLDR